MLESQKCNWIQHVSYKTLPKIGYIAMLGDQPIAAGFLRRVEGGYGQLDTFVTNPHFGSKMRDEGLNKVVDALLIEAKDLDLIGIIAITQDSGIIERSKKYGFRIINQVLIAK